MQTELRSPLRNSFFALICLVSIGLYLHWARQAYLASDLAAVPDPPNLKRAIQLEPSNAEYRDLLGRNLALSGMSLNEAIANYRIAVHLNPFVARYWLDLAGAYQIAGRTSEQEQSVEQAVVADPTTPHVAWEAANFFLVQGNREKTLRYFRVVLANDPDPDTIASALTLCWRATGDSNQILDRALPRRPDLYLSFLRFAYLQTGSIRRGKRLEPSDRIRPEVFDEAGISLLSLSHRQAGSRSRTDCLAATGRRRSFPSALSSLS